MSKMNKLNYKTGRADTERRRVDLRRRRQFMLDLLVYDIELLRLRVPARERLRSLKRFLATFGQ
jgi:hypothetical protein